MTIEETYVKAKEKGFFELVKLIEFLVFDKAVLDFEDDNSKLDFYFQDKFHDRMNGHLKTKIGGYL